MDDLRAKRLGILIGLVLAIAIIALSILEQRLGMIAIAIVALILFVPMFVGYLIGRWQGRV